MGEIRVGISGWTYAGWRGDFYPDGLAQRRELEYAAERLNSIEINGSFYSLQRPTSYAAWREQTPDDFVFAVKGGRFITHLKQLADVETPLANFFASGVLALGPKLGPILWQLPPNLRFDADRLADFFDLLPRTTTEAAALAQRHDDKVPEDRALTHDRCGPAAPARARVPQPVVRHARGVELLREHDIALRGRRHRRQVAEGRRGHQRLPLRAAARRRRALRQRLQRRGARPVGRVLPTLGRGPQDVFVYFDNDIKGYAPHDAMALQERLGITTEAAEA